MKLRSIAALGLAMASALACAQAPLLQDGARALRQTQLDWTLGQEPLGPSSMPSLTLGWGGAGTEGSYTPLIGGEGLGTGTQGWGLGLQGRITRGGWFFGATALVLRDRGHTAGVLQRASLGYRWEAGWRVALEQGPLDWGTGLTGGELLGAVSRGFPRLALGTPDFSLPLGRWRLEVLAGRLPEDRPIPTWMDDASLRLQARAAGLDLHQPHVAGGRLQAAFGALAQLTLGTLTLEGGHDEQGHAAPESAARTLGLAELRVRLPGLARLATARGASLSLGRSTLAQGRRFQGGPPRTLAGLQLVWEGWDLAVEYASPARPDRASFAEPSHLAGFSTLGDPLGSAFGRSAATRTLELGLTLPLEGQGRFRISRITAPMDDPVARGSWFLQGEAQWRTDTGRLGGTLATRRCDLPAASPRWGWSFALFQAFRVF